MTTPGSMPPPPAVPKSAKAKGKQKANPDDLAGSKRKRLACEICRIRRVRCEWKDSQNSCLACLTAEYQCPGEPTRKKRAKKGEIVPDDKMLELEAKFKAFDIGGAMTFQMIERGFKQAPNIPGLTTEYWKTYVRKCAGASQEREIAAEVLCAAFVAGAAAFTDHAKIVASVSPDMPVATPSGVLHNYESLIPFGSSRSEACLALAFQSRQIFEDSTMRHRPSPEAIYCLIVMDWMANLTREHVNGAKGGGGTETNLDVEFAEVLSRSYRTLMMGRRSEIGEKDLEMLLGPVNAHLFFLDARNAAVTGSKLVFRDIDLSPLFPLTSDACATPLVDYSTFDFEGDSCQQLGQQLLPLVYSTSLLFRKFIQLPVTLCDSVALLQPIWSQIDQSLSTLALTVSTLPSCLQAKDPLQLRYDLESQLTAQQLHLAQLDLLIHQKIVQAFVVSSTSSTPPSPTLLQNYTASRSRIQDVFKLATELAQRAIETSAWSRAREVVAVLSTSSAWTSLAKEKADPVKLELLNELGITLEMGQTLEQCLALAAWSSPQAAVQRQNLLGALAIAFGPLPPNNLPPPPTTLPAAPRSPPSHASTLEHHSLPKPVVIREADFEIDLSFLDDFAREHGIPIEGEKTESPPRSEPVESPSSATLAPPLASIDWDTIMSGDDLYPTEAETPFNLGESFAPFSPLG